LLSLRLGRFDVLGDGGTATLERVVRQKLLPAVRTIRVLDVAGNAVSLPGGGESRITVRGPGLRRVAGRTGLPRSFAIERLETVVAARTRNQTVLVTLHPLGDLQPSDVNGVEVPAYSLAFVGVPGS
jgi:hypothetical protein